MASQIDDSIPADNVKAVKSEIRENFRVAKEEITEQQRKTSIAWRIAIGETSL